MPRTLSEAAFLIGVINGSSPNSVASLTISDCSLFAPTVLGVAENFGAIVLRNVTFVPSPSNVVWVSPQTNHVCGFLRPSPLYGGVTYVGSSLSFENCQIYRNPGVQVAAVVLESDSTIENLIFNGFGLQKPATVPHAKSAQHRLGGNRPAGFLLFGQQ